MLSTTHSHPLSHREKIALRSHLLENVTMLAASIFIAVMLVQSPTFKLFLSASTELKLLGSFVIGFFFTSLFTTAPATVAFAELAQTNSIILIALVGGVGAVLGDIVLFKLLKTHVTDELVHLLSHPKRKRFLKVFHAKTFRWLFTFLGMIIIASPLPDELGLTMMGISKLEMKYLIPVSFIANTVGIILICLVGRSILN
ncbi:MAG: hypothetical protein AAB407_03655 [Patescibacteria group bacterium]